MKRLAAILAAIVAFAAVCTARTGPKSKDAPQMTFVTMSHDFGTMTLGGEPRKFTFEFVNDGTAPLVVIRAATSCRCIKVDFPRRPIPSGGKGVIEITYDPKDEGAFNKGVHIYSNIEGGSLTLFVKGEVVK